MAPAPVQNPIGRHQVAKGQKRSTREAKKPKSDKSKKSATVSVSPFSEPPSKVKPARDK